MIGVQPSLIYLSSDLVLWRIYFYCVKVKSILPDYLKIFFFRNKLAICDIPWERKAVDSNHPSVIPACPVAVPPHGLMKASPGWGYFPDGSGFSGPSECPGAPATRMIALHCKVLRCPREKMSKGLSSVRVNTANQHGEESHSEMIDTHATKVKDHTNWKKPDAEASVLCDSCMWNV